MSRAYRISVKESVRRLVRAGDHVSCRLELLEILPAEQMGELLAAELMRQGFQRRGDNLVRSDDDVTVTVDVKTAALSVTCQSQRDVEVSGQRSARGYDDSGVSRGDLQARLKDELNQALNKRVAAREAALQREVTDKLEGHLQDLRREIDHAVNRATAEALKQKAAQLGQIKQLTEDPESGSLTIVVEV